MHVLLKRDHFERWQSPAAHGGGSQRIGADGAARRWLAMNSARQDGSGPRRGGARREGGRCGATKGTLCLAGLWKRVLWRGAATGNLRALPAPARAWGARLGNLLALDLLVAAVALTALDVNGAGARELYTIGDRRNLVIDSGSGGGASCLPPRW